MEACWLKTDQLILAGWNLSHGRMKVRRIDKTLQISRQTKVNNAEDYLFKSLTPFVKWLLKRTWHLVTQWYGYNCIFFKSRYSWPFSCENIQLFCCACDLERHWRNPSNPTQIWFRTRSKIFSIHPAIHPSSQSQKLNSINLYTTCLFKIPWILYFFKKWCEIVKKHYL